MSKRRYFLQYAALFFFLVSTIRAQYRFDSWTTDDGLPQNSVYSITNTPDGYLWLTTLDGLVRFDGVRFTVFNKNNQKNLPGNRFVKLFAEADNTLWICTEENGLVRYQNGKFQTFTTVDGLPSNRVHEIQKDTDGSLLILTQNGTARWRDGRFTSERQEDFRQFKIYLAPSGNRWEIDNKGFRVIGKDGGETRFELPFDSNKISPDRTFNYFSYIEMLEDSDRALWLSAAGKLFKLKDDAVTTFAMSNGMPSALVRVIAQDRDGAIWIGTEKQGACRLQANRFDCFGTATGLSSDKIFDIYTDREGTLWIGTNERGFNRVTNRTVTPLSTAEGLADKNIYPILEDKTGGVWIGSFSTLSYFKDGKIKNYSRSDGLLYEIVQSLFEDTDGRLWIGSVGGVEYLENGKFYDFTDKLNATYGDFDFWDIHRDRNGAFWFATNKGLIKYENGAATCYTTADGLPGDDVKIIHKARDGTLWIGTYSGLAVLSSNFKRQTFDVRENRLKAGLRTFNEQNGLAGNHIRSIYEDEDGAFWIGTYDGGLSRFKDGVFSNYTTENGLFSNGVFQILPAERGNFWMSSNQGIYRVSRAELNDFADGKIRRVVSRVFGKSDGMLSAECNGGRSPAGIKTRDGRLWFPTQDGAAIINPESVPLNKLAPPVVIESVKIDGVLSEPLATANNLISSFSSAEVQSPAAAGESGITVEPHQNNLEIQYTGLSFIKPEQVQFKYKLEGLDENWTDAGTRREVYYPYLPPGKYTFRVIAANNDNVWNESGAEIKIVVLPPFYRTSWFIGAVILGLATISFALYRWRVSTLEIRHAAQEDFSRRLINAHEAERRRIAAELHDSIGQTLAMIKNSSVFGAQTIDNPAAKERLEAITAQTTQAIGEVREISYNLRPYLLENLGLIKSVKSLVAKIEEVHLLKINERIDNVDNLFSDEAEMSVYRIVQESLNNVAKHAEADEVDLRIEKRDGIVTIIVADNGCGFDRNASSKTNTEKGGFGLLGIAERVRMLGGTLDIETAKGIGTKITIKIAVEN